MNIIDNFLPFARPDYIEGMIIGDDLDSLLTATWLHKHFGWPLVGVYCQYTRLFFDEKPDVFREKLLAGRYFAVDLDIYHPSVPSLGHHILHIVSGEKLPGQMHSLNPNTLRGLSIEKGFRWKYPLATIHFLLWLYGEKKLPTEALLLVWLADSSFINAQFYRENVENWVRRHLPHPAFVQWLDFLQTADFEAILLEKITNPMSANPLCHANERSKYRSKHLGISGFQCQFDPEKDLAALADLLRFIEKTTQWQAPKLPANWQGCWKGQRREVEIGQLRNSGIGLGDWLEREGIFSYAFTYRDRMNCTRLDF